MDPIIFPLGFAGTGSRAPLGQARKPPASTERPGARLIRPDFSPGRQGLTDAVMSNHRLVERLAGSTLYHEFQAAFEGATHLPLTLRAVENWQLAHTRSRNQNGFCALLSGSNHSCSACLQMQQCACDGVNGVPSTISCTFGLSETAVGVKIGQRTIAYLQTGQVFFKLPTVRQTRGALQQIKDWGLELDAGEVIRRYQASRVVRRSEYDATVRLLQFFAGQLGPLASQILLAHETAEPAQITRARDFIEAQHRENLSLTVVARHAGMSACYFCKTFREATGVGYTQYLSLVRVEAAKKLMLNRNTRISEICYEVGFQSLAHFNRVFRSIVGENPSEYRQGLPSARAQSVSALPQSRKPVTHYGECQEAK